MPLVKVVDMKLELPETLKLSKGRKYVVARRFEKPPFSGYYAPHKTTVADIPPIVSNVEKIMEEFPQYGNCEPGVVFYQCSRCTGDTCVTTSVRRLPIKKGGCWTEGFITSGASPGTFKKGRTLKNKAKKMLNCLAEKGIEYEEAKLTNRNFSKEIDKGIKMFSTARIEPSINLAVLETGPFSFGVLTESRYRRVPSPEKIREDILKVAGITEVADKEFRAYFMKRAAVFDSGF